MAVTLEQLQAAIAAAVSTALQARGEGHGGGGGKKRRVIVEKDFRSIDKFDGVEKNWKSFEFNFRIAMRSIAPRVVEAMDKVAATSGVVTGLKMEEHDGLAYEGMEELGAELFEVLCMRTSGSAQLMIREAQDGDGFAAWQILSKTFGRKTLANSLRKYREAVNPTQAKEMSDVVGAITRWENAMKELERTEQERIPEMIKLAALTQICTGDVRDMIFQNIDTTKTYESMREKVVSWVSNRVASGAQSVPMDIGEVDWQEEEDWCVDAVSAETQCYRCGGKGHMASKCATPISKGKGKGQDKGKGKGKGGLNGDGGKSGGKSGGKGGKAGGKGYQGTCWNCGKVGHKSAECWQGRSAAAVDEVDEENGEAERRSVDSVWMIASVEEAEKEELAEWEVPRRKVRFNRRSCCPGHCQREIEMANAWQALEEEEEEDDDENDEDEVELPPRQMECGVKAKRWTGRRDRATIDIASVEKKKTKITVDSGAGVSVWPASWGCPGTTLPSKTKIKLEAANGTPIETYGEKLVKFEMDGVEGKAGMKFLMTDVQKPLAAVSAIVEAGNEVVFRSGVNDSFIRNPKTGEKVPLKRERGTYTMEVVVDDQGFSRQA